MCKVRCWRWLFGNKIPISTPGGGAAKRTTPPRDNPEGCQTTSKSEGWTLLFFFFTLVTGPRRSLSLKLSGTRVYAPQIRARLGTTAHFCRVIVLKLRAVPSCADGLALPGSGWQIILTLTSRVARCKSVNLGAKMSPVSPLLVRPHKRSHPGGNPGANR